MPIHIRNSTIGSSHYKDRSTNDSFFHIIRYLSGHFTFASNGVLPDSFIYRNTLAVYFIFDTLTIKKYPQNFGNSLILGINRYFLISIYIIVSNQKRTICFLLYLFKYFT